MVQKCCVPQCTSKVGDLDIYGIKIRFHRMPHTADRFMQWCLQITDKRRFNPMLSSGSRVCSKHFRKEDYLMKKPFGNNPLKLSAEPCIFKWNSACFEDVTDDDNINKGSGSTTGSSGPGSNSHCKNNTYLASSHVNTNTNAITNGHTNDPDAEYFDDHPSSSSSSSHLSIARTTFIYDHNHHNLKVHRDAQCSILNEKLIAEEIARKNSIIEQLLGKISLMENEQKTMQSKISELRAANTYYEKQIREVNQRNQILEQRASCSAKQIQHLQQNNGGGGGGRHHVTSSGNGLGHHGHSNYNNNHNHNNHGHHNNNGDRGPGHHHRHQETQSSQQLQQATTASYRHSNSQPELPESDHDSYYDEDDIYIGPKTKKSRAMYVHKL